jgi:hypothetical protein
MVPEELGKMMRVFKWLNKMSQVMHDIITMA